MAEKAADVPEQAAQCDHHFDNCDQLRPVKKTCVWVAV
jgi:hypothetical protein